MYGLLREDGDASVHRHRRGSDAASCQEAHRVSGRVDHPRREAHPDASGGENGRQRRRRHRPHHGGYERHRVDPGRCCGPSRNHEGNRSDRPRVVPPGHQTAHRIEGPVLEVHRGHHREWPLAHGYAQLDGVHLGVGQHLPLQSLPVPVGQPPVPGFHLGGHGHLRGPYVEDGRRLPLHSPRRSGTCRQVAR